MRCGLSTPAFLFSSLTSDQISGELFQECLKSMGLGQLNKSKYFVREASHLNRQPPVIKDPTIANHTDSPQLPQASFQAEGTEFTLPNSMTWCSLPAHRELFPSDDIIPDADDGDLLDMEILEEQQVSLADSAKSKIYEESLWTTHHST